MKSFWRLITPWPMREQDLLHLHIMQICSTAPHTNATENLRPILLERFSRAGPRGRGREWATLGVHPLSWLLSNNRLEKVPFVSVLHTSSNRLLLSNQDKGCTRSVAHSLPLPLGPRSAKPLDCHCVCVYGQPNRRPLHSIDSARRATPCWKIVQNLPNY